VVIDTHGLLGGSRSRVCDRSQVSVDSVQAVMDVLQMGAARRTTAATLMNSASSRSHAVFTVTVESNPTAGSDAEDSDGVSATPAEIQADPIAQAGRMVSKLTFVDLAGSERLKRTGVSGLLAQCVCVGVGACGDGVLVLQAQGDRMREGIRYVSACWWCECSVHHTCIVQH